MTIQLMPEDEEIVQERLRSGAFHSAQEVIHHALQVQVQVQDTEESWLALHRREVREKLERAMEEFDRGGGVPGSQAHQRLREMKAARLNGGE